MTQATREALESISQTLHEAGWDASEGLGRDHSIEPLRRIALRDEQLDMLMGILAKGLTIEEAGKRLGLAPPDASRLFADVLRVLSDESGSSKPRDSVVNPRP